MREFVYTILDDFDVLHYGNIDAESAEDAEKKIQRIYDSDIPVEIWSSSKNVLKKKSFWPASDRYYLQKSNINGLVYAGPRIDLLPRIFFLLLLIAMGASEKLLHL